MLIWYMCFLTRIVTEGEKREVWCLTLENVSTAMKPEDKEREQNMYKDVSSPVFWTRVELWSL